MGQNAVTDTLGGIDLAWPGSVLSVFDVPAPSPGILLYDGQYFAWGMLCLIIITLVFRRHVRDFFSSLTAIVLFPSSGQRYKGFPFQLGAAFVVATGILCFVMSDFGAVSRDNFDYPALLLVIGGAMALKAVVLLLSGYVSSDMGFVLQAMRLFAVFTVLSAIMSILLYPVAYFVPDGAAEAVRVTAIVLASLVAAAYLFDIVRIIFTFQISPFFSFLYLCTLEILPAALLVATVVKY